MHQWEGVAVGEMDVFLKLRPLCGQYLPDFSDRRQFGCSYKTFFVWWFMITMNWHYPPYIHLPVPWLVPTNSIQYVSIHAMQILWKGLLVLGTKHEKAQKETDSEHIATSPHNTFHEWTVSNWKPTTLSLRALVSWLLLTTMRKILLVDWSSSQPLSETVDALMQYNAPHLSNVTPPDIRINLLIEEWLWVLSRIYNLSIGIAENETIVKVYCDYLLHLKVALSHFLPKQPRTFTLAVRPTHAHLISCIWTVR